MDRKIDLTEHGDFQHLHNFLEDVPLKHKIFPWDYSEEIKYYIPWLPTKSKILWQGPDYFNYLEFKSMDEEVWIGYPWDFEKNQLCTSKESSINIIKRKEIQSDLSILYR